MIPEAVRFAGYAGMFRIEFIPGAERGEVTAYLQQQTDRGQYLSQGLRLEIRVDPMVWREMAPPERSPGQAKLVEEFLRQYPEEGRAQLRAAVAEQQRQAARLATCSLDSDELNGTLVSLRELAVEYTTYSCGPFGSFRQIYWDGGIFYVDDLYCGNPDCNCQAVHLDFLTVIKNGDGKYVLESLFQVEVPLDTSKPAGRVKTVSCTANVAKALLNIWMERRLEETLRLWPRYNLVKTIAMRSIKNPRMQVDEVVEVEPSRNEPCPCGSGRKYKNCCGKES